jgi:hypothetical protein
MNESAVGKEALNVGGLKAENSTAKEKNSPMWKINDASSAVHAVSVSDYMLGKYEITMEQYLGLGPLLAFLSVSLIIITLLIRHFWKNTEIYQNNLCQ